MTVSSKKLTAVLFNVIAHFVKRVTAIDGVTPSYSLGIKLEHWDELNVFLFSQIAVLIDVRLGDNHVRIIAV